MQHYKFIEDYNHYEKGDVIKVEKVNKLLAKLIKEKIVEKTEAPKKIGDKK